jgi:septal ring factor EnvC (AmiA/AmiB activator)
MLVRSYYLQKLEEQKAKQADQIKVRQDELEDVKEDLQQSHFKNQLVLNEIRDEKTKLGDQQAVQRQNVEKIKAESTDLLTELRKYREQKENLEQSFASLISEEERIREAENERLARLAEARKIADASRRAEEVAKYSASSTNNFVSDETLKTFEQNFSVLKGKLPWPVTSTTISQKFGVTRNPLYGTQREHPGINIVTNPGEEVRVVSDGQVIAVQPVPGYGNVVFVKHGTYYTAYGNLSEIDIASQSVVEAGTIIGRAGTQISEMGETLFFMVRKNKTDLNPEDWLSAK